MITPGEWKITCERNRKGAFNNVDATEQEWPRKGIALLPCDNPDTPDNQRLISAAPKLLKACEEGATVDAGDRDEPFPDTLESIGRGTDWEDYCVEKAKQIRAAVAKARGGA